MKSLVCAFLVGFLCLATVSVAKELPPKVQVYSRIPGEMGKNNIFICHVSGFHPPEITIELLKNGEVMLDTSQTELAFDKDFRYHLTKDVPFTPSNGERFACKVTHLGKPKIFIWEPDM